MEVNYQRDFPKTLIGKYSKKSVHQPVSVKKWKRLDEEDMDRMDKCQEGSPKDLPLHLFYPEPVKKELHPCMAEMKTNGWEVIQGVMESGASESVANPRPASNTKLGLPLGARQV